MTLKVRMKVLHVIICPESVMPATPSSPIQTAGASDVVPVPGEILAAFARVPDPRLAQGRRHDLVGILALAGMAVIAGAQSVAAIGQWALDVGGAALDELGLGGVPASLATFHRVFRRIDAERFDQIVYAWSRLRFAVIDGWRVIAADGKTVRGARSDTRLGRPRGILRLHRQVNELSRSGYTDRRPCPAAARSHALLARNPQRRALLCAT